MHIEISATGLYGATASIGLMDGFSSYINDEESVISSFKTVESSTYALNGGAGNLQSAVDEISSRIKDEEEKKNDALVIQKQTNDFLDLAVRVDSQVAELVVKNRDEFYKLNPWLKPEVVAAEERTWYENVWHWICGAAEDIGEGLETAWNWVSDTAKKAWNAAKEFYEEHKKIIDTILIVVGAVAAIAAVVASGGLALAPLLTAIGLSSSAAIAISATVAIVAVVSTVGSSALNIIDTWCEIDNPVFNTVQKVFNITSTVSNLAYSVGNTYNSIKKIDPSDYFKTIDNSSAGTYMADYFESTGDSINHELLNDLETDIFYDFENPNGGKVYVSATPATNEGVYDLVQDLATKSNEEYIVLSGTHGSDIGELVFKDDWCPGIEFFKFDSSAFKDLSNVSVLNMQKYVKIWGNGNITYNTAAMNTIFSSGKNVVCAWCYSDCNSMLKSIFGVL